MPTSAATAAFVRQEWRFLLFGLLVAFWSSPGQTFFISLFSDKFRGEFGLSHGEFGAIYTTATLISAVLLWPTGQLFDRLRLAAFAWAVAVATAGFAMAFSFVSGPISLLIGILAVRFTGQGLMSHIALTAMARRYDRTRGRAIAIASLGFPLGEAVFPPLAIWSLNWLDWPQIWIVIGIAAAVTLLPPLPFLLRRTAAQDGRGPEELQSDNSRIRHWTRSEMLRDRQFYLIAPLPMAHSAIITGILFHQVHIVTVKNWNLEWWALCFAIFATLQTFGNLASGWMVDRWRARRLMPFIVVPMILGLLVLAGFDSPAAVAVILGLLGLGSGMTAPVSSALWPELYGTRHLGAIRSTAAVLMVFGSALGPVAMGWALDDGITVGTIAVWSAAIAAVISGIVAIGLRRNPL